jgi:hypothetical protein
MKNNKDLPTEFSQRVSDLENELRSFQPLMPDSLRDRQSSIQFELGYQMGKASAHKWQFGVWILAVVTVASWLSPLIMVQPAATNLVERRSAERPASDAEEVVMTVQNENVLESELQSNVSTGAQSDASSTVSDSKDSQTIPTRSAFSVFALLKQLHTSEVSSSTGAYSEYRERAMIIGTDALPEFKMASQDTKKEDVKQDGEKIENKWFDQTKWSSLQL